MFRALYEADLAGLLDPDIAIGKLPIKLPIIRALIKRTPDLRSLLPGRCPGARMFSSRRAPFSDGARGAVGFARHANRCPQFHERLIRVSSAGWSQKGLRLLPV